jgi:hypothetical protein
MPTTTRNSIKKPENLAYATENALQQLKEEVGKVCVANEKTEKHLRSLVSRLDDTEVGFVLFCVGTRYFTTVCPGCHKRTEGTRGERAERFQIAGI